MKSGTTYLNKLLGAHPAIFMCLPEEPSYFVESRQLRTLWPETWDQGFWRSEENYLRLFQGAGDAVLLGEASTNYAKYPVASGVPERIFGFHPGARFIYLMRDPVERTISHYWHRVRFHSERRPILKAIQTEPESLKVSHYAMQLLPYFERFGRGRVATLTFEELTATPVATMRILYEWLGVDSTAADISVFGQAENVTPEIIRMAAGHGVLRRLRQTRPLRVLTPYLPQAIRKTSLRLATRPIQWRAVATSNVIDFLQSIQQRQTEELAQLLGRPFPLWTTLYRGGFARELPLDGWDETEAHREI